MSVKLMTKVFEDDALTPHKKLIMLALCDNANDEGICYPSIDTLQSKTSLSRPTVIKIIGELTEEKYLISVQRSTSNNGRKSKIYLVFPLENYEKLDSDWKEKLAQSKEALLCPQSKEALPKKAPQSKTALPEPLVSLFNHELFIDMNKQEKDLYLEYIALRKQMKLITTLSTHNSLLKKFFEFGRNLSVIQNAIDSNWKDFYAPKQSYTPKQSPNKKNPSDWIREAQQQAQSNQDVQDVEVVA